jgi:hypothetical protein
MLAFNGGLRLRVSIVDGRLQRKLTPQILFIGVFSTNGNAVFSSTHLNKHAKLSKQLPPKKRKHNYFYSGCFISNSTQ